MISSENNILSIAYSKPSGIGLPNFFAFIKYEILVVLYNIISENNTIIGRSLSFGLIMSLLGLVAVLVYLLIRI